MSLTEKRPPPEEQGPQFKKTAQVRRGRFLLIAAGITLVGIGGVGIVLPLLPTTPFLLAAAFCFARASERMYRWLRRSTVFGPYLMAYQGRGGLGRRYALRTGLFLWASLMLSGYFLWPRWWALGLLAIVGLAVSWHLLWMTRVRWSSTGATEQQSQRTPGMN